MKKIVPYLISFLIFAGTLYLLFRAFDLKKSFEPQLKRVYTYIDRGQNPQKYLEFFRAPHSVTNVKVTRGTDIIYDQTYYNDEYMFRIPMPKNKEAKHHAIFGGCSFTYGEGLGVEDTFPWIFQKIAPDYSAYNLGIPGGSVNVQLRYNDFFALKDIIKEDTGVFIYTFMDNHLDRFFERNNYLSWAHPYFPHYDVENDIPVYKGFIKDRPSFKAFMKLKASGLENTSINMQDRNAWSDEEVSKFAAAISALRKIYLGNFPKGEFIFAIHPTGLSDKVKPRLLEQLSKRDVRWIDSMADYLAFEKRTGTKPEDLRIPYDLHPNGAMNQYYADYLVRNAKTADRN